VIGPNASLSARQALGVMGLMATISLGIGMFFALQGLWPILPFAGLELAALGAALIVVLKRNRYREVLVFQEETIRVEIGMVGQGIAASFEVPRSRARVLLENGPHRNSPSRLLLSDLGRRVEIGRCLTDEERERIAGRMRELIHPGWQRSPIGSAPAKTASGAWWS
jgi:uncharacterized membrane protein